MIVTCGNFDLIVDQFTQADEYGLDTETSGTEYTDRLFSIILATEENRYYFNFIDCPQATDNQVLPREWIQKMQPIFERKQSIFDIHNAKFDLRMLASEGIRVTSRVHCTQITARILHNNYFDYSLDSCVKRMGQETGLPFEKDSTVEDYIKEHGLYETFAVPGKKQKQTKKYFHHVPLPIISKYAENDAWLHLQLGKYQRKLLEQRYGDGEPSLLPLYENEHRLLRVCLDMEKTGVQIDKAYVTKALNYEQDLAVAACDKFLDLTGVEFTDSAKALKPIFEKLGSPVGMTEKGNASFSQDVLDKIDSPVSKLVTEIRKHGLYAGTYYATFLNLMDDEGVIHPQMRQDKTYTGRFSYGHPNLQNIPKEQDKNDLFVVRSSIVPRRGYCLTSIDYNQQEYRMFLDYAGEMKLIAEVMAGKDVHQATADAIGKPRQEAKTINFAILYGAGVAKLAESLKVDYLEAKALKHRYFMNLPEVEAFISLVSAVGKRRGYIWNWAGRRCYISDPKFAYKLVNHMIQGGCADVVKIAMVQIHDFLKDKKSRMVLQVHDELVFEIHESELHLVDPIKHIMENVYKPRNGLQLTCSVDHSWRSWGYCDKIKGYPNEAGNPFQRSLRAAS